MPDWIQYIVLIVKFVLLLLLSLSLSACVLIGPGLTVPHANYKLKINDDMPKSQALILLEKALLNQEFQAVATGWEGAENFSNDDIYETLKQVKSYQWNDIEISYYPDSNDYLRLSYYEHGTGAFSASAIERYYLIKQMLIDAGLEHVPETSDDIKAAKPVTTPEQFNESSHYSAFGYYFNWLLSAVLALGFYIVIILIPVWILSRKVLNKLNWSIKAKRGLFIAISASLFYPTIVPISMFGPVLLVPGIVPAPVLLWSATVYREVIMVSVLLTLMLSAGAALKYIQPTVASR